MPEQKIAEVNLDDLDTEEVETEEVEETEATTEEETEDEVEEEAPEEDESEEAQAEEDEFTDNFREWAEQFGELPDGIQSEEDLLKAYQSTLPEMKRHQSEAQRLREVDQALKAQGFANGVSDVLNNQRPAEVAKPTGERYFQDNAARSFVEKMVKDGVLEGDNAKNYQAIAKLMDQTYGPQFDKVEQVFTTAMKGMVENRKMLRDILWGNLPDSVQKGVDRTGVEKLLDQGLFSTMEEAIRYVSFSKPDVLNDLTKRAEQRGQDKARKKLRKPYALRRSKTPTKTQPTYDYEKFKRPDGQWDEDKIIKSYGVNKGLKMIEAWEAEHK